MSTKRKVDFVGSVSLLYRVFSTVSLSGTQFFDDFYALVRGL